MEITVNNQYTRKDLAYATVYEGYIYIFANDDQDAVMVLPVSEWTHIVNCVTKTGWHNDGSAVA
jgi:hypothetical protein